MKNYFLIALLFLFTQYLKAQSAGSLDPSFAGNGYLITNFNNYDDGGYAVAIQMDGKIIVAGEARNASNSDFGIVRYNANGTYDSTFGTAGKVTTSLSGGDDIAFGVGIQPNGKIVAAGTAGSDAAVVRYNTDGTLDNTFGTNGIVITDIDGSNDYINAMTIQADGKIVLAGYAYSSSLSYNRFALIRYNTNGTLDNTFGTSGKVIVDIGNSDNGILAIALQTDQKIVVSGWSNNGQAYDYYFATARFNTNGTLDNTFGTGGSVITGIGGSADEATGIAIQSDGKIVVGGAATNVYNDFAMVRYNTNGTLDNSFGISGKVTTDIGGGPDYANEIALETDGKIILAGYSYNGSMYNNTALVRYNSNGTIDNTFGTNGKSVTTIGNYDNGASSMALQTDGKIIISGWTTNSGDNEMTVARLMATGTTDYTSFSKNNTILVFPNPNNGTMSLSYNLDENEEGTFGICDLTGRIVFSEKVIGGKNTLPINASQLEAGVYFYQAVVGNNKIAGDKIVVIK